jgi:hypothetical protein
MGETDTLPAETAAGALPSRAPGLRCESLWFALAFVLIYATLATLLFRQAPLLFSDLDRAFDADLGSWTIDLARPQGPHLRTQNHPLSVLLLNPLGSAIREVLRALNVDFAARLAAQLLCAVAGGLAVGAFRALLFRLHVSAPRARLWTLLFATSATQVFFSSLPESYAFSALSLVTVFLVAAGQRPAGWARLAAGVFAFGVTITNLVAVALARASDLDWGRTRRALRSCVAHVVAVVLAAAALSLVQRAIYPTAGLFFVPSPLAHLYSPQLFVPETTLEAVERFAGVVSKVCFASLAAPELQILDHQGPLPLVRFARVAFYAPTPVSAAHWLLWSFVLIEAVRGAVSRGPGGSRAARGRSNGVVGTLWLWLGFVVALHSVFGTWLFLYSGHWVFALVAVAARGIEARPRTNRRAATVLLVVLVSLQVAAQTTLVTRLLTMA